MYKEGEVKKARAGGRRMTVPNGPGKRWDGAAPIKLMSWHQYSVETFTPLKDEAAWTETKM